MTFKWGNEEFSSVVSAPAASGGFLRQGEGVDATFEKETGVI